MPLQAEYNPIGNAGRQEDAMGEQQSSDLSERLAEVAGVEDAHLTTTGRASGEPQETDLFFAVEGERIYFLAGGGAETNWVKNAIANPEVVVQIAGKTMRGTARVIAPEEEEAHARRLLAAKYERWREGRLMSSWARIALPVAVDVAAVDDSAPPGRDSEGRSSDGR
jgi:deazaflavin-dependent oxidoreductase (nitroreductase family)